MTFVAPLLLILGALISLSSFIIARKPEAKELFAKVAPYQGFVGVGLLVFGAYALYYYMIEDYWADQSILGMYVHGFHAGSSGDTGKDMLAAVVLIGLVVCSILIGFMLGFGIIAAMTPGESAAEKKGLEIQKKLLGLSLPIGVAGLVFAVLWLAHHPHL